jgi:transcriptional regulator with XRE-family HTH domain
MDKSIHQKKYHSLISLLRDKREAQGITQVQLAERLNVNQTVMLWN